MKRIVSLLLVLLLLAGCTSEVPTQTKTKSFLFQQDIICVEGKKIWVAETWLGDSSSLTSQIVGECSMEADK